MKTKLLLATSLLLPCSSYAATVFISEFHYDDAGADANEFVEVYVSTSIDIADVEVTLYNGSSSSLAPYGTISSWTVGDSVTLADGDYTIYSALESGIQNGGPDGLAVGVSGVLCEFLSYEGTFTASGGIADGVESTDVGVNETSSTAENSSLERTDAGWVVSSGTNSRGVANANLTVNPIPEPSSALLGGLGLLALLRRRR